MESVPHAIESPDSLRQADLIKDVQARRMSRRWTMSVGFATAALCHSIVGDINYLTCREVETLMKGIESGRVQR